MSHDIYDAIIIGGGPAGLATAFWLARYRRRVCVLDGDAPRNDPAWGVHGYPGIVDPSPTELRRRLHGQAINAGAEYRTAIAGRAAGTRNSFAVETADGETRAARRIVLAYGLRDRIPDVPGLREHYGTSVFHCPDCDGPTVQDRAVGVIGNDRHSAMLALYLLTWTPRVVLLSNGEPLALTGAAQRTLREHRIACHDSPIGRVVATEHGIAGLDLADGSAIAVDALFFHLGAEPCCDIAEQLGCARDDAGFLATDRGQETSVPGVHAAGDIAGHPHLAIIAAADGVRAALAIHRSLLPESLQLTE